LPAIYVVIELEKYKFGAAVSGLCAGARLPQDKKYRRGHRYTVGNRFNRGFGDSIPSLNRDNLQ
jgi:hypothetical protein